MMVTSMIPWMAWGLTLGAPLPDVKEKAPDEAEDEVEIEDEGNDEVPPPPPPSGQTEGSVPAGQTEGSVPEPADAPGTTDDASAAGEQPTTDPATDRDAQTEPEPGEEGELDVTMGTTTVIEDGEAEQQPTPLPANKPPAPEAIARGTNVELGAKKETGLYKPGGSSQWFGFELKFGPYLPEVDRNVSGDGLGPYAEIFGETNDMGVATGQPRPGLFTAFSFEWQFFYLAGPLNVGLQAGFFRDTADALIAEPVAGESVRSEADSVSFSVVPLALLAGYRFEMLADRWKVPLVPYVRGGPAYGFWWSRDGNGDISENDAGEKGRGGTWGWQINAGGMLRMDWIEPSAAKKLDISTGINHTYLFGEYQLSRLDGFGNDDAMSVGDSTWLVGIAVEL